MFLLILTRMTIYMTANYVLLYFKCCGHFVKSVQRHVITITINYLILLPTRDWQLAVIIEALTLTAGTQLTATLTTLECQEVLTSPTRAKVTRKLWELISFIELINEKRESRNELENTYQNIILSQKNFSKS